MYFNCLGLGEILGLRGECQNDFSDFAAHPKRHFEKVLYMLTVSRKHPSLTSDTSKMYFVGLRHFENVLYQTQTLRKCTLLTKDASKMYFVDLRPFENVLYYLMLVWDH